MTDKRTILAAAGAISLAVALLLGIATIGDLGGTVTAARTPVITLPSAGTEHEHDIPFYEEPCEPWRYHDTALDDFRSKRKELPGSISPELLPRMPDKAGGHAYDAHGINPMFRGMMCGSSDRDPNSLAALGVLTAVNGGKIPRFSSPKKQAAAVARLMETWLPEATYSFCSIGEPGMQTVYGYMQSGKLALGKTVLHKERWSCYGVMGFGSGDAVRYIWLRLECLQATAWPPRGKKLQGRAPVEWSYVR